MSVARSPSPALNASATTPSLIFNSGEHVFCIGSTDSGKGTFGLGADAAQQAERARLAAYKKAYWSEKESIMQQRRAQDAAAIARWEQESKLTPRKRLAIVMQEREEQIQREIKQRKQWEEDFKRTQKEEAARLAAVYTQQRKEFRDAQEEARELRRAQVVRETEAIKRKEEELVAMHAEEMAAVEAERKRRCERLRAIRKLERKRAEQAAKERFEQKVSSVHETKEMQAKRDEEAKKTSSQIVHLKGELTSYMKKTIQAALDESRYRLEQEHHEIGKQIAAEEKALLARKELATQEELTRRKAFVVRLREEATRCQEELQMQRAKQRVVLQQQAKELRETGKKAIEEEKQERIAQRLEHINDARALIEMSSQKRSKSPVRGGAADHKSSTH